jgi:2',3'-cyclic-nucleotide 2'-phosphodiesterase (5'-nucleotidase family)
VREFREKEHVLFLNVGGNLGGFWFNHFGSKVVIDFMRALQFDVIALGLSDYALNDVMTDSRSSFDNLTQFISNVSLVSRIVSCNVDVDTKYISNFYQIVRKSTKLYGGNRRIGVIGFVKKPNDTIISSLKRDFVSVFDLIKISDPIKCLQEEAENLRKEGIDIIIAIGSGDSDYFKEIASNVPNVDVVIGGYASSKNMSQLTERTSNSYPDFVVNANSGEVIISTADVLGKSIGKMSITFDKKGVVKSNEGVLIKLDNNVDSGEI